MIPAAERERMLAVPLCGPRVLMRLETIGIRRFADLAGRDPWELMHRINVHAGRPIWHAPMAIIALGNLIEAAERAGPTAQAPRRLDGAAPAAR